MDPEIVDIVERIGTENPPTDQELAEARQSLVDGLQEATSPETLDLDTARSLRRAIDQIDQEQTHRQQERDRQQEEASRLLEGIDSEDGDETADEEAGESGDETADEEAGEQEPVPASVDLRDAVSRARQVRVAREGEEFVDGQPKLDVIVSGPATGAGTPQTLGDAAALFHRHAHQVSRGRQALIEFKYEYPRQRQLGASVSQNTRVIDRYLAPRSLVAAGGICEPVPANFDHPICGERGRPIRDALPDFGATRGGVRFAPTATLSDLSSAVDVWTQSTDASPGDSTKPCPSVDCQDEIEVLVDAVTACLTVGNFQARFNPEFWESRLDLLMIQHDREAEARLFTQMQNEATSVSVTDLNNSAQTALLALDKAAAGIRSRHRLMRGGNANAITLRFVAPAWLRDALRASLARQGPGDGIEALHIADQRIDQFFAERNISPVWSPDLQVFPDQADGTLQDWPDDQAVTLLFPEGSFIFLDGGVLDLGTEIRDSTLNSTNDRQAFMETFEQVAHRGCESLELTLPVGEDCVCSTATVS